MLLFLRLFNSSWGFSCTTNVGSYNEPLAVLRNASQNLKWDSTFKTYLLYLEHMITDTLDYRYNNTKRTLNKCL